MPYEPVQLYTSQPIVVPTPSVRKTKPPVIKKHEALLGYTNDNVNDSFFWSTLSTLALHNSTSKMVLTPEMLRKKAGGASAEAAAAATATQPEAAAASQPEAADSDLPGEEGPAENRDVGWEEAILSRFYNFYKP